MFINRIAIVLPRASVPLSGLYHDIVLGHSHVTCGDQSHAWKSVVSDDVAKSVPEWPA